MASAFLEINRKPHIVKELREDNDRKVGNKIEIDFEGLSKLKYITCAFNGELRLHSFQCRENV